MKVKVDLWVADDYFGGEDDHAVVEITDSLRERVRTFHRTLNELGADFLEEFDYGPEFVFEEDGTRIDVVRRVVARDGDFWWQGYIKNTDIRWGTGHIPFALLDEADGGDRDLREYQDRGEEDEGASHDQ